MTGALEDPSEEGEPEGGGPEEEGGLKEGETGEGGSEEGETGGEAGDPLSEIRGSPVWGPGETIFVAFLSEEDRLESADV